MKIPHAFSLAVLGLLTLAAGVSPAQDKVDQLLNEMERLKAQFAKDKAAEKKKVLNKFDAMIRSVMNSTKGKAADRLALADRLRTDRSQFDQKEDLPDDSDLARIAWDYGTALVGKYRPLSKKFDEAMNLCIKDGDTKRAQDIKDAKEKFDNQQLPGRRYFAPRANYLGTRYTGTSATPFHFHVFQAPGGQLKARAEQDVQFAGHPVYDMNVSLDGVHVACAGLKNIQGNTTNLVSCDGVVLGETLILKLIYRGKNNFVQSFAVLRKR